MKNRIDVERGRYWDYGWQIIDGCTRCSPGCNNCWSLAMEKRFIKGLNEGRIVVQPDRLDRPLRRKKPTVYAVWNDLFHEDVPFDFIHETYDVIKACPQHIFLALTKRPERMAEVANRIFSLERFGWAQGFWSHLWHGLTVCNQQEADEKIPIFLQVPGKKFLSIEPMLGPISLRWIAAWNGMATKPRPSTTNHLDGLRLIDAVVLGAESGRGARFMDFQWARGIRNECQEAGVPFFLKHISKKEGRVLDGRTHDDLPWIV